MPGHLEFVRFDGTVTCFGLPIVRFSTEDRLQEITRLHEDNGWYTSAAEPEQLAWLLKMVHLLHQLSVRGDGDPITQAEMAAFTHTPRCVEALTAAATRLEEA